MWQHTAKELFGNSTHNPHILYALNLGFFCNQLPSELKIDPEYIINNMIIFPFFKPFMIFERAINVIKRMVDDAKHVAGEIGTNTGKIFLKEGRIVKVCKACLKSDENDYEEAYIHRIHQVPGNFLCIKHNTPLSYFSVPEGKSNYEIAIDALYDSELASFQIKPNLIKYYISLGEDIEFVLNGGLSDFSIDTIKQRYRQRLQEKGYLIGNIKQIPLSGDFKQFYPVDFLESLESNFDDRDKNNWLQHIVNCKIFVHPIRHLLFIRFLFGSTKEFLSYIDEYKPFGNSPYPCLNPAADHYKQDVIRNVEFKRYSNPVGVFKCDCGFVYCRQGPDKTEDDRIRYQRVIEYGDIWYCRFKELINKGFSMHYIVNKMKCTKYSVIKYATSFGILDKLNTKERIIIHERKNKISDSELNIYKEELTQFIIDNPNALRKQIKEALYKQYDNLQKRDRQWLEKTLPQPAQGFVKCYHDKERKMKDEELFQKIKQIVSQILLEEKPRRITRSLIANKIYYGVVNKRRIMNLPKTEEYLLSCCETVEQFRNRMSSYHL